MQGTADAEWAVIEPHLSPPARRGRTRETNPRDVVDSIFFIAQSGCQWRLLPKDFPPYCQRQADVALSGGRLSAIMEPNPHAKSRLCRRWSD
jgi:transposase